MGKNRSHVSELMSGKRPVSDSFIRDLERAFPRVNGDYIRGKSETMFVSDIELNYRVHHINGSNNGNVNNGHDQVVNDTASLQKIIEKQQAQIDRLLGIIEKMQS